MTGTSDFGTIEIGKRAGLVLIGGNPFEDIANTDTILGVTERGRWYSKDELVKLIELEE